MSTGYKIIETTILDNSIDISNNKSQFKIKNDTNDFLVIDQSENKLTIGPQVNINLENSNNSCVVADSSVNYILVDSSASLLKLGNLSEINFNKSPSTIDIKINDSSIQKETYITGFIGDLPPTARNTLLSIPFLGGQDNLLEISTVLKASNTNNSSFSVIDKKIFGYNYLNKPGKED
jgi:hypothetical protein